MHATTIGEAGTATDGAAFPCHVTLISPPQAGHGTRLPAKSVLAMNRLPHWHVTTKDT
jgi:hypothetical protein